MSQYIASTEYAAYGLTAGATTDTAVKAASGLIDAYCHRPEGLVWAADDAGNPVYMKGATALRTWKSTAAILPGSSVVVPLSNIPPSSLLGDALVLDKGDLTKAEACTVIAVDGANATLASVARPHAIDCTFDLGLVITERKNFGYQAPVAFLTRTPIARILAAGSRWDSTSIREPSLSDPSYFDQGFGSGIGVVPSIFNGPRWSQLDPNLIDCDIATGRLQVGAVAARSEVKVSYLAGWAIEQLPDIVKQVCAAMTKSVLAMDPDIPAGVKMYKAGDTAILKFADSVMDEDMRFQLRPFMARRGL